MASTDGRASPRLRSGSSASVLTVPGWERYEWLWHGFSTRGGGVSRAYREPESSLSGAESAATGDLNLGFTSHDNRESVLENRLRLVEAVTGGRDTPLITAPQVHSSTVLVLDRAMLASGRLAAALPEADGLMTAAAGLLLAIQTADCIPVLVIDPVRRVVAAFHAGWRGTSGRIVEQGISRMVTEFGSRPEELQAAIGPGIGPCCYTVGEELREEFSLRFGYASELFSVSAGGLRLDLREANRRQLLDAGVPASSIAHAGGCTGCQPEQFFSHRTSGGRTGRMMSVVGIRGAGALISANDLDS